MYFQLFHCYYFNIFVDLFISVKVYNQFAPHFSLNHIIVQCYSIQKLKIQENFQLGSNYKHFSSEISSYWYGSFSSYATIPVCCIGPQYAVSLCIFTACACDPDGAASMQCDRLNGRCTCIEGVTGDKCDRCARGTTGTLPYCVPCGECFDNWDRIIMELKSEYCNITV